MLRNEVHFAKSRYVNVNKQQQSGTLLERNRYVTKYTKSIKSSCAIRVKLGTT